MTIVTGMLQLSEPTVAATALREGSFVAFAPGDRTVYALSLVGYGPVGLWLVAVTPRPGCIIELPQHRVNGIEPWLSCVPRGWWSGLRPVLAALGVADLPALYQPGDALAEAEARRG